MPSSPPRPGTGPAPPVAGGAPPVSAPSAAAPTPAPQAPPAGGSGSSRGRGPSPRKPQASRSGGGGVSLPRVRSAAQAADGFLFGLIAYAVALSYIQHGWPGVVAWGRAKFLNQPTQGFEKENKPTPLKR